MDNGGHNMHSDHLLPGERFVPMEDEQLLCYLKPMLNGEQVPGRDHLVFECDLYGNEEPWQIWDRYKDKRQNDLRKNKDLFFMSKQKNKTPNDARVDRTVGNGGTWKEESSKPVVFPVTKRTIGNKKTFGYKNKGSEQEGRWIMLEYELDPSQLVDKNQDTNYVICLLRKKREPKVKKNNGSSLAGGEMAGDDSMPNDETNQLMKRPRSMVPPPLIDNEPAPLPPLGFRGVEAGELQQGSQPPCMYNPNVPAPLRPLGFAAAEAEVQQRSQPTPCMYNPYAQTVSLPVIRGEANWGEQQYADGDQQYWKQFVIVPPGEYAMQQMRAGPSTRVPHSPFCSCVSCI